MSRVVRRQLVYPHPPDRVWRALTDPVAIAQWLMPNDFEPRVGHRFQFRTTPRPGFSGVIDAEVLLVDPPRRLCYAWAAGGHHTTVTWTLEPTAHGTRVTLEHAGFRGATGVIAGFMLGFGWRKKLRQLGGRIS